MKRGFYTIKNEDGTFDTYEMPAKKARAIPYKKSTKAYAKKSYGKAPKTEGYVRGRYTSGNKASEIKAVNYSATVQTVSAATNFVIDLTAGIAEGVAVNQRVGQQITCTSVDIEANFYITNTNTITFNYYTWYLILDKQPNFATAAASDIFTNTTSNLNQRTLLNQERFVVLATEYNEDALSATGGPAGKRHKRFVKTDITTRYQDNTSPAGSNSLLWVVTSNSQVAPNTAFADYVLRLRYADE